MVVLDIEYKLLYAFAVVKSTKVREERKNS